MERFEIDAKTIVRGGGPTPKFHEFLASLSVGPRDYGVSSGDTPYLFYIDRKTGEPRLYRLSEVGSAKTEGVILTGWDEWIYLGSRKIVIPGTTYARNAIYDTLVRGLSIEEATPDIVYSINSMLQELPNVRNVLVWVNWFYATKENGRSYDPSVGIKPLISVAGRNAEESDWSVAGYTPSTALVLPDTNLAGTPSDESVVWVMQYLKSLGLNVGLLPVVRSYLPTGIWRGLLEYDTRSEYDHFASEYAAFIRHYTSLFESNGITPDFFVVASEMDTTVFYAPPEFPFVDLMTTLCDEIRTAFPSAQVWYAANWSLYSYGTTPDGKVYHPLDKLYASGKVDHIGLDYYYPITLTHTHDYNEIYNGFESGIDWDVYVADYGPGGYRCSESLQDGSGLSRATLAPLSPRLAKKNIRRYAGSYHFDSAPDVIDRTYSLPPDRDYLMLSGSAYVEFDRHLGPGAWYDNELPTEEESRLKLLGGYASGTLTGLQVPYSVNLFCRQYGAIGERSVLELIGALKVSVVDSNTVRVVVKTSGGDVITDVPSSTIATAMTHISVSVEPTGAVIRVGGTEVALPLTSPNPPTGAVVLAPASPSPFEGEVGRLVIAGEKRYDFRFLESAVGVVTDYVPASQKILLSEYGFPSVNSATVTPYSFPDIVFDCTGPWNTTFEADEEVQYVATKAFEDRIALWQSEGWLDKAFIYAYEARPRGAWDAKLPDRETPFYSDGANLYVGMPVNGKMYVTRDSGIGWVELPVPGVSASTVATASKVSVAFDSRPLPVLVVSRDGVVDIYTMEGGVFSLKVSFVGYSAEAGYSPNLGRCVVAYTVGSQVYIRNEVDGFATATLVHNSGRNVIVDKAYYDESGSLHFVGAYEDDLCSLAFDFPT